MHVHERALVREHAAVLRGREYGHHLAELAVQLLLQVLPDPRRAVAAIAHFLGKYASLERAESTMRRAVQGLLLNVREDPREVAGPGCDLQRQIPRGNFAWWDLRRQWLFDAV